MSIATVCPSHLATWSSDPPSVAANREGEKIAQAMKKHTQTLADQKKQDKAERKAEEAAAKEAEEEAAAEAEAAAAA